MSTRPNATPAELQYADEIKEARRLYRDAVLPELIASNKANLGDIAIIAIDSGDYEVDPSDITAINRLRKRRPTEFCWIERIGYQSPYSIGSPTSLDS